MSFVLDIPIYLGLLVAEWWASRRQGRKTYDWADTFANLSCGLLERVVRTAAAPLMIALYMAASGLIGGPTRSMTSWWDWLLLFLMVDFCYYWLHRAHHEVACLWAVHIVHHQSPRLNFSVGIRSAVLQSFFSIPFYAPVVLLGFPPLMFGAAIVIQNIYQLLKHTETVRSLGPLEHVLNTPSHHRVHHGCQAAYLDKNHGAMLITWDKLFGTYTPETEPPVYGTVTPFVNPDPIAATFTEWRRLAQLSRQASGLTEKLKVWFGPPGDRSSAPTAPQLQATGQRNYATQTSPRQLFIGVDICLMAGALMVALSAWPNLAGVSQLAVGIGLVAWMQQTAKQLVRKTPFDRGRFILQWSIAVVVMILISPSGGT